MGCVCVTGDPSLSTNFSQLWFHRKYVLRKSYLARIPKFQSSEGGLMRFAIATLGDSGVILLLRYGGDFGMVFAYYGISY